MPKEARFIRDRRERGIAEMREQQAVGRTDGYKLTDVDGIGPSTADELREAGVEKPAELSRVTPNQLEAIDGIGPKRAEKLADKFQYGSDRVRSNAVRESDKGGIPEGDVESVREEMAERSPAERRTDRAYNAKITLDPEVWKENPDEWDFPGVDTIPEQRRTERVKERIDRLDGGVSAVDAGKIQGGASGRHTGGHLEVDVGSSWDAVSTLAHETGHAVDYELADGDHDTLSEKLLEDEQVREEAKELTERRRVLLDDADQLVEGGHYDERDYEKELFADAFAVATEEPRAAKREAPTLMRKLQDETLRDVGRF